MSAPLKTFDLFPLLPVELRNEIFAAAIQPRLVRIEHHITKDPNSAKYDEIMELALKKIAEMDSRTIDDPAKTYTEILAGMIGPDCNSTAMLESFRNCTYRWSTPRNQLTTHTDPCIHCPNGIDFSLLERHGRGVIERLMRTYHFRSLSPIPALLHTCRESRRAMQLCGYELAFPFENTKLPRIWYNFQQDTLYLHCLYPSQVSQLPSTDLVRVERLAVQEEEYHVSLLPEILPIFGHLRELLCVVYNFPQMKSDIETEGKLWGYLDCDTPEFRHEDFYIYARIDPWELYTQLMSRYRKDNGGSTDGFFAHRNAELQNRFQEDRDNQSGRWPIPECKHVYIVTRIIAGQILAFREKAVKRLKAVERLELEQGPQLVSYAPFDDECEVLQEIEDEERSYY